MDAPPPVPPAPDDGHVPVEHRLLGLDRRTIPLALVVLAIMALYLVVVPAINRNVDFDDEVRAGDVITLGNGITFVPPEGWNLMAGIREGQEPTSGVSGNDETAAVADGGVTITVRASGYDGTADELLDQVDRVRTRSDAEPNQAFTVTGPRTTVTTDSGISGVSQAYTSATGEGRILAFTFEGGRTGTTPIGLTVTIDGSTRSFAEQARAIETLIASIQVEEAGS
ncbi:MAG TPA: hypothetical protein VNS19_18830 [Acidimicrobiales bacterium]|nr:hypothetical protein [Acidimicrobiales bacterium]